MTLHLLLLVAYSLGLIALGLAIGRFVRGTADFFVAGRRLGAGLIFSTVLAANIGAGSTVGATGEGFRIGLGAWWWNGSAALGSLLLAVWIGPRIWTLAERYGFLTVGDFLEHRYGAGVRGAIAGLLWLATLTILAGQLIGVATILKVAGGVSIPVGCAIGGLVITAYFTAGGLLSSAWVNLVQLVVLLGGFASVMPSLLGSVGGLASLIASPALPADHHRIWQPQVAATYLALLVPPFIVSPGLLQKTYGATSAQAVRQGVGASAIVLAVFAFIPALIGMIARLNHPDLALDQLALPTVLVRDLPPALGSLLLAAVFSAEISTADAVLFMLATSLSQDLYRRFLKPDASDREVLRAARLAAVAGGVLGTVLGIVLERILTALSIFYTLLGVSLFVPVLAGLYVKSAGRVEAASAIAAGLSVTIALQLGGVPLPTPLTPPLVGIIAAAIAFGAASVARRFR
ncbi:MAG: sodium:solute symporter family protein [Acidobacteria bacterium]|nr:sodium:solute symporter family protein [Acidobacteriota bacterium]MBI3265321.1 sodium:solute symporter family protein [Acidobacteriota bacterium]